VSRLYLDNAATSFPKPPVVYDAMMAYARDIGASPGRGQYQESREGARLIRQCRERVAGLIGLDSPSHIVFTLNTSDALNLAIKGVVRAVRLRHGAGTPIRLVTTTMDHNSVLRPFAALAEEGATVVHVSADRATGRVDLDALRAALAPGATLLAVNWVSNVTGTIQPLSDLVEIARERGIPTLVDLAQGLGHVEFSMAKVRADLVASPGHKGLLGPQGTGALAIRPGFEDRLATTREGGTGSIAELDQQPVSLPERYEAGSHNTMGIVGLSEAADWIAQRGVASLRRHERELSASLIDGLLASGCSHGGLDRSSGPGGAGPLSELHLLGDVDPDARVGTFSLVHRTLASPEMALILETHFGILARAGIHCAPLAHRTMGSLDHAAGRGALRLSLGPFVTAADVARVLEALRAICEDAPLLSGAVAAPTPTSF
jgi:selenocysteine lyase/cysteine desulfurase